MASEPMSDEQLETFRQTADDARRINTFWSGQYAWTVVRLLAEVERLRAREASLVAQNEQAMKIVMALDVLGWDAFIGRELWGQARALLASKEAE